MLGYTLWKQGRNAEAKATCPEAERNNGNRFWADVEQALKRTRPEEPRDTTPTSPNGGLPLCPWWRLNKAAGEASVAEHHLTGPASPRRSVCAPGRLFG